MGNSGTASKPLSVDPALANPACFKPMKRGAWVYGDYSSTKSATEHVRLFDQGQYTPSTYSSCAWNEYAALRGRALAATPEVDDKEMQRFCRFVKSNFRKLFPGFKKREPLSLERYLEVSNASPRVKGAIRQAGEWLAEQGVDHDSRLPRQWLQSWTRRKAFVKVEMNLNGPFTKGKAPRLIQGARPEFIALVGPSFVPIQRSLKECWSTSFGVCFTSGVTSRQIGDYLNIPGRVFENDVSAWDASVSVRLCELEVWLARRMGLKRADIDLMRANINTHGVTTHGLKYGVKGTRKSGDPYTSCFNSLLNGCLHLYCFCRAGYSLETVLGSIRMCVQGDDNLMVFPEWMKPRFSLLLKLGFKSDNIYRRHLAEAQFCSQRMYRCDDGWVLGPKLGRVLAKFGHFADLPKGTNLLGLLRGVALGYLHCVSYVPGLRGLVQRVLELTEGHDVCGLRCWNDWWVQYEVVSCTGDEFIHNRFRDYEYYGVDPELWNWSKFDFGGQFPEEAEVLMDRDSPSVRSLFVNTTDC